MMAPMTEIAAANPNAWFPIARTVDEIVTPRPDNRMVGYPYTKYMVAVMDVDMAAALVMTSHAEADRLGVPADRRVYLRGWCYATDPVSSPSTPTCGARRRWPPRAARRSASAGIGVDDVAHFDLYSCFGSSLHFACDALGIAADDTRALTVTGGLPYHGGPGEQLPGHAIAAMVETLRADPGALGAGERRRHAHDEARVRRVLHRAGPGARRPIRRVIQAGLDAHPVPEIRARARRRRHGGGVLRGARPRRRTRVGRAGLRRGHRRTRTYAKITDAETAGGRPKREELVGRTVRLTPTAVAIAGCASRVRNVGRLD